MLRQELAIRHSDSLSVASLRIFSNGGLDTLDVRIPNTTDIGGVIETQQTIERRIRMKCIGLEACVGEVSCRFDSLADDPRTKVISSACLRCFNQACPTFLGS